VTSATSRPIEVSRRFRGELLQPGEAGYDSARTTYNRRIQGQPAVVARCLGVQDVVTALALARDHGLEVSVRGGGHSVGGWSTNDGGLVIDLTLMRQVRIDAASRTAWVGGGTRAGDLLVEAERFGLVAATGVFPSIGLAGLTMGLGEAYLTPRHGYGADNLLAFELVTADGELLRVSADEHPDLFWAMRGAGANFGVVTALQVRLHPAPEHAVGGSITFDGADVAPVTRHLWDLMENGSEYFWPQVSYEADAAGELRITVGPGHTGSPELAAREIDALCAVASPIADERRAGSYLDLIFETPEPTMRQEWDLLFFPFDGDRERHIDALLAHLADADRHALAPGRLLMLWRSVTPGAPAVPSVASRAAGVTLFVCSAWDEAERDEAELGWTRETNAALRAAGIGDDPPNTANHVSTVDDERVRRVYGAEAYARLAELKARYDPQNVFHRNFNVPPAR
jgi:hypothetical protein